MSVLLGRLNHSPADIFRHLLINHNLGTEWVYNVPTDWPITADTELDLPDNFICVTNTTGELHGRIQVTGEQPEHFGIQIKARSSIPNELGGWNKLNDIAVAMDQTLSHTAVNVVGTHHYVVGAITRKGGILSVGREQGASKRFIYTLNAVFVCHQLS